MSGCRPARPDAPIRRTGSVRRAGWTGRRPALFLVLSLAARLAAPSAALADPGTAALTPFLDAVSACAGRSDLTLAVVGLDPGQTAFSREQAEEIDLPVVAEGVERPAQLTLLRALGCKHAQGYLLGRPVEVDAVPALLDGVPVPA